MPDIAVPGHRGRQRIRREHLRQRAAVDPHRRGPAHAARQLRAAARRGWMRAHDARVAKDRNSSGGPRTWPSSAPKRDKKSDLAQRGRAPRRARPATKPSASSAKPSARRWAWHSIRWPTTATTACRPTSAMSASRSRARNRPPRSVPIRCCAKAAAILADAIDMLSGNAAAVRAGAAGDAPGDGLEQLSRPLGVPRRQHQQDSDSAALGPRLVWGHGYPPRQHHARSPTCEQARRLLDADDLGLDALGAAVGLSPAHLQRRFRAAFGLSPAEYRAQKKLATLKRDLRGNSDVTRALYEAGYGSSQPRVRRRRRAPGHAARRLPPRRRGHGHPLGDHRHGDRPGAGRGDRTRPVCDRAR